MNVNSKLPAPTVNQWLEESAQKLDMAGIPSARLDAELLLAYVLGKDRTWLIAHSDELMTDHILSDNFVFPLKKPPIDAPPEAKPKKTILERANALLKHRLRRVPIAYLTGHKEFYGRDFIVTPDVLIPRPESEMIIHILKELPLRESPVIYDVGTGSGSLAITIALEIPTSSVLGSDISPEAITIAHKNAERLEVRNVHFRVDNLLSNQRGPYDAIVANLPYVDPKWQRSPETNHEPALALFADEHGLKLIKDSIQQAADRLIKKGYLLLEADPEQHATIIDFAAQHGLTYVRTDDYVVTLQR